MFLPWGNRFGSLITHMLFELWLILIFSPVANFAQHPLDQVQPRLILSRGPSWMYHEKMGIQRFKIRRQAMPVARQLLKRQRRHSDAAAGIQTKLPCLSWAGRQHTGLPRQQTGPAQAIYCTQALATSA